MEVDLCTLVVNTELLSIKIRLYISNIGGFIYIYAGFRSEPGSSWLFLGHGPNHQGAFWNFYPSSRGSLAL